MTDEPESPQGCTPEALVEKVARAIETADTSEVPDNFYKGDADDISDWGAYLAAAVIAVLRPALRAAALEEAAKVAEYRVGAAEWSADTNSGYECAAREIAADIRALKEDSNDR